MSGALTLRAGSSATMGVTDGPGGATDWIALHAVGAPESVYLNWRYLNGATTPPTSGVTSATVQMSLPIDAGSYEFRLHPNNGYGVVATSAVVTVTATTAQLTVNGAPSPAAVSVGAGTILSVGVSGGSPTAADWVGLYGVATADTALLQWQYLSGTTTPPASALSTATLFFFAPTTRVAQREAVDIDDRGRTTCRQSGR